ncbi:MAG: hypothetical protein WC683_09895 [bacterium]
MSNYASAKAASEIRGGHYRIGATITPIDPDSHAPTNVTLRGPGSNVLAVTDGDPWPYDSSDTKMWFESVVESFGDISCAAEIHSAFQTLADPRLVLRDVRINGVLDNGQLTFASGTPAESPTLTGDEVRLSQLLQYYVWQGAAVEYKVYYFAGPTTDDTATYKTQTIFKGIVQSVDLPAGQIVFNLTQSTKAEDTLIPSAAHRITDPPDPNAKGQFIPIVFGAHNSENFINSNTWLEAIAAGFHPALAPVISWKRTGNSPDYLLVTNDCYGPNTDWGEQDEFASGGASDADDGLVIYLPEADAFGKIVAGTSTGQSKIYSDPTGFGGSTGITVIVQEYQTADVYVPCDGIYTDVDSLVDDPAALFDRSPYTYANVSCDDTDADRVVQFTVSPITIMGEIPVATDCIGAYILLNNCALSGSPGVDFGIYSIASADWVGGYAGSVQGNLVVSELEAGGLRTQAQDNSTAVPVTAYVCRSGQQQPIMRMDWRYVANNDPDPDTEGPMVVRMIITNAGSAGDAFQLISVGVICRVKLKTGGAQLTRTSPKVNILGRIVR